MVTGEFNAEGNPAMDWHPIQRGVEILPVASNRDKLRPDGPLGPNADFTFTFYALSRKSACAFYCIVHGARVYHLLSLVSSERSQVIL